MKHFVEFFGVVYGLITVGLVLAFLLLELERHLRDRRVRRRRSRVHDVDLTGVRPS